MIALESEALAQIVIIMIGALAAIIGGTVYVLKRRYDIKLEEARQKTTQAEEDTERVRANAKFQERILAALEGTLAQSAHDRQEATLSTQQFTTVMRDNAAAKNQLAGAIESNSARLSEMTTSLDANTETLNKTTETVSTQTVSVESVVASLRDVSTRLGALETKFDARDESDRQTFHAATEALNAAIKHVQAMSPVPVEPHIVEKDEEKSA